MIQLLTRSQIDVEKWDNLILKAYNSEIYATSWFLDVVSPNWKALVYNDYEAVMPLPVKQKFGFSYIVQPPFCQKLGIFSKQEIAKELEELFTQKLSKFISVRYCSNSNFYALHKHVAERANFVLPLINTYEEIAKSFNSNCKRNIKKAITAEIQIREIAKGDFEAFFLSSFLHEIPVSYSKILHELIARAEKNTAVEFIGAYSNSQELCGATAFFKTDYKIYYLLTCSNQLGKSQSAMFAIIDNCVKKYANSQLLLDFEGSSIAGVAQFYKGFGAYLEPFYYFTKHKISMFNKFL